MRPFNMGTGLIHRLVFGYEETSGTYFACKNKEKCLFIDMGPETCFATYGFQELSNLISAPSVK